jgi:agmatine/peptidylarginine deiminase
MIETIFFTTPYVDLFDNEDEYQVYKLWFNKTKRIFEECNVNTIAYDFPDIWTRDFLPIQNLHTREVYFTEYNPIYDRSKYKNDYKYINKKRFDFFPQAKLLDITLDGGNLIYIKNGLGFLFEKPRDDEFRNDTSTPVIIKQLKSSLGLEKIISLPSFSTDEDPFCHIDGFMQFLSDEILMVSDCNDDRIDVVKSECPELRVVEVPSIEQSKAYYEENPISAKGIYVNYLETEKTVFVPQYNIHEDEETMAIFRDHTDKHVVGIDCEGISKLGGSLHCLTKELII